MTAACLEEHVSRRARVVAALREHAIPDGLGAAGLTSALEWLDHMATWDVDGDFPFPADSLGNPTVGTSEWLDWSAASGERDLLEAAASLLRSVLAATAQEPPC